MLVATRVKLGDFLSERIAIRRSSRIAAWTAGTGPGLVTTPARNVSEYPAPWAGLQRERTQLDRFSQGSSIDPSAAIPALVSAASSFA
jgi:hypothetical protein